MSSRQAAELDHAFERNGFDARDVKKLSEGDILAKILPVIKGSGKMAVKSGEVVIEHFIDCNADPLIFKGWEVENHQKSDQLKWDPKKILLHLDETQKNEGIRGKDLRKKLKDTSVLNANVLDYLLANPHLIPDEWKDVSICIIFWGTIYRHPNGYVCVRFLNWDGISWYGGDFSLSHHNFYLGEFAALLIK
jgi:hypothetical protein